MNAAMSKSARAAWHQRGYNDGVKGRTAVELPDKHRATYLAALRAGRRERERLREDARA